MDVINDYIEERTHTFTDEYGHVKKVKGTRARIANAAAKEIHNKWWNSKLGSDEEAKLSDLHLKAMTNLDDSDDKRNAKYAKDKTKSDTATAGIAGNVAIAKKIKKINDKIKELKATLDNTKDNEADNEENTKKIAELNAELKKLRALRLALIGGTVAGDVALGVAYNKLGDKAQHAVERRGLNKSVDKALELRDAANKVVTKECIDDTIFNIYEAYDNGYIDEDEASTMLELLESKYTNYASGHGERHIKQNTDASLACEYLMNGLPIPPALKHVESEARDLYKKKKVREEIYKNN